MDLETMKTIWKKENEHQFAQQKVNPKTITNLMKQKSNTTFASMKRSMKFKTITSSLIGTGTIILAGSHLFSLVEESFFPMELLTITEAGTLFAIMGLVLITVAIANASGYKRISRFEQSSKPIKQMLEEGISILRRIISLDVYSDAIFVPIISGFAAYVWLFQREAFVFDIRVVYLLLIVGGTAALSHIIASRLSQIKHGGNLRRIQGYLNELELQNGERDSPNYS